VNVARNPNNHLGTVEQGMESGFNLVSLRDDVCSGFTMGDKYEDGISLVARPGFLTRFVDIREESLGRNAIREDIGLPNGERGELDARWGAVGEIEGEFILRAVT